MAANSEQYWDSAESVQIYAAAPFLFHGEQLAFAEIAEHIRGRAVLDLACGGGRTTYFLKEMGAQVIGVDLARNLIEAARRQYPTIDFRVGNAAALEFSDESFDVVLISFNSLDCLYPKALRLEALQEVRRVLRPGGYLIFSHHNSAALLFGYYRFLRPSKVAYRLRRIVSGEAFRADAYLPEMTIPGMKMYYAWPKRVIADVAAAGFDSCAVFPNAPHLAKLQTLLHSDALTRLLDPWPYHLFQKRKSAAATL